MAQIKNGINGIVSGKAGNVVFYTMYGKNIVRSKPSPSVKSRKPSLKQNTQRQKMTLIQQLLQPFKDLIKITFAPVTLNNAAYHVAKSYNMRQAIKGDHFPNMAIDWQKTLISAGNLELPEKAEKTQSENGLGFTWSVNTGRYSDSLLVVALSKKDKQLVYRFTGISRSQGHFKWDIDLEQKEWHVWIAFRSKDETNMSNSLYLGLTH